MAAVLAAAGDTQNQTWSANKSNFGFKMLQKMGWTEGKGLGMHEDGETSHIKLKKKSNNLGIGAEVGQNDRWFSVTNNFDDLLTKLAANNAPKKKKKKKNKEGKEEKEEAGKEGGKKKRKREEAEGGGEAEVPSEQADKKRLKAERKAKRAAKRLAKQTKVVDRNRARAKNARGYSAEAMKEILGAT